MPTTMYQTDTKGDLQHKKAYDSQNPKPLFLFTKVLQRISCFALGLGIPFIDFSCPWASNSLFKNSLIQG